MQIKSVILFSIGVTIVAIVFILSILNLTQTRNLGFDSQDIFIYGGYANVYDSATTKLKEYDKYISINSERIESYGLDIEQITQVPESIDEEKVLDWVNEEELEVGNIEEYREDVLVIIKRSFLALNIKGYNLTNDNKNPNEDILVEIYQIDNALDEVENVYDTFYNNLELDEVYVKNDPYSLLTGGSLSEWNTAIIQARVNTILIIYVLTVLLISIYRFFKKKDIWTSIIFCLTILASVYAYRQIEENYQPAYMIINDGFGINKTTNDEYFLTYTPIIVIDDFISEGGDVQYLENEDGERAKVNWSNSREVKNWMFAPYDGDPQNSNLEQFGRIRERYIL